MSRRGVLAALTVLVALLLPLALPLYPVSLLILVCISAIIAVGLVLLTGIAGLTSFGQAAFMGVGAYTSAVLTTQLHLSPWLGLPAGLLATGLVALVLGLVTLRMQGHYLPLATIAWGTSLYYVFGNTPALGGFTGLQGIPALSLFGLDLSDPRRFAYLALLALALCVLAAQFLLSSRTGRAIRALRGGPLVAEAFGASTFSLRVQTFVLSALLASLAGWLYAHQQLFVNPTPFGLSAGIEYLFMAVVGGIGTVWGGVAGAGLITAARDQITTLLGARGNLEVIFFGLLVIGVLQLARRGLWPVLERLVPAGGRARLGRPAPLPVLSQPAADTQTPLLSVQEARKTFGGLKAVNGVSFELFAGEILALIGPNGAGKSTLFNLITGVSPATAGRVVLAGHDVTRLPARRIHRLGLARTFQHVKLLPELSLLHNAMMGGYARAHAGMLRSLLHLERGEEAALQAEALRQLERVGLSGREGTLAGNLPLGQQRLLEVARALVADPLLLLLDEPAAGLRRGEKGELSALLRRLRAEGVTILLVEHDMELVMNLADRVVVMSSGEKLAEGSPREVRADRAVQEAYLGVGLEQA